MGDFVASIKTKAYFKRYQVKFRRRREGKTDYYARKRLISMDRNKYSTKKYRLVVRITNRDVICQIIYAKLKGDHVLASAYAHELSKYGLTVGLTNYAACYATGLLLARRLLQQLGLDKKYVGVTKPKGKWFLYKRPSARKVRRAKAKGKQIDTSIRPFKAVLDVGLRRTTTGARVFAAMKGAVDGGLHIPHSPERFAGFRGRRLNTELLRQRIFGQHVADYMKMLKEKKPNEYKARFSKYIEAGIGPDDLEELYGKVHAAIRADPKFVSQKKALPDGFVQKRWGRKKMTLSQRKDRVRQKIVSFQRKLKAELDN